MKKLWARAYPVSQIRAEAYDPDSHDNDHETKARMAALAVLLTDSLPR